MSRGKYHMGIPSLNVAPILTVKLGFDAPQLAAIRWVLQFKIPGGLPRGSFIGHYLALADRQILCGAEPRCFPLNKTDKSMNRCTVDAGRGIERRANWDIGLANAAYYRELYLDSRAD